MATKDVLVRMAPIGLAVLKSSVSKVNATGKTADSLRFVVDTLNERLQYIGRGYFETLETYRGPRKSSSYGHFDENLEEWMQSKGFPQKVSKSGVKYFRLGDQWFSAKSLAWKINKDGNKKWKGGEKVRDVYSNALAEFVETLVEAIKQDKKETFKEKVLQSLKAA
jgi:hypothetical protein